MKSDIEYYIPMSYTNTQIDLNIDIITPLEFVYADLYNESAQKILCEIFADDAPVRALLLTDDTLLVHDPSIGISLGCDGVNLASSDSDYDTLIANRKLRISYLGGGAGNAFLQLGCKKRTDLIQDKFLEIAEIRQLGEPASHPGGAYYHVPKVKQLGAGT